VAREIREETGLTVEVERLTGVYKNMQRGIVALVYRCRPGHGAVGPTQEAAVVRWVQPSEAADLMTPAYAIRVLDALADEPASRAHDGTQLLTAGLVSDLDSVSGLKTSVTQRHRETGDRS
jgi:8-oxo-dGTP pyrophosphatase MutT (NUDIX family)